MNVSPLSLAKFNHCLNNISKINFNGGMDKNTSIFSASLLQNSERAVRKAEEISNKRIFDFLSK